MTATLPLPTPAKASRRVPALIAALALALAGLATTPGPARASDDDLLRFLLGAAAVAVIIRSIDGQGRGRYIDRWTLPDACLETVRARGRTVDVYHRGCLNRADYRNLPGHCQINLNTDRGRRVGYEALCLYNAGYRGEGYGYRPQPIRPVQPSYPVQPWHPGQPPRHGAQGRSLPQHCALTYRQGHQRLNGYDGRCLRDAGLRNLPQQCRVTARSGQRIFEAGCLRDAGYRHGRS